MDIRTKGNKIASAAGGIIQTIVIVAFIAACVAVPIGTIWVAVHFIGKYW